MAEPPIADRARFDQIRYAQLWEDADVLLLGLGSRAGATLVSICSAGDNALAMLTLDPKRIIVVDLSPAQLACLTMRMTMYRELGHADFLELMGSRPSSKRPELLRQVAEKLPADERRFWLERSNEIVAYGLGGVGKFERYFRIMRRWLLPLVHRQETIEAVFEPRSPAERERFLSARWSNRRWRILLRVFFSNFVMGRLGRDPAFFDHVDGSLPAHVSKRIVHAAVDLDPSENPYLHWILTGTHGAALPLAWRPEHYATIRDRLDRLEPRLGSLEQLVRQGERADGFNLSDIFEYMDEETFAAAYASIVSASNPGARLVYWNMMVPRRAPSIYASRLVRRQDVEQKAKALDKAFFYSDFVVEELTRELER
jgi:S-adenosylmethionine-diacylglycerol 3-amino-3-carboxypropyl transferase